MVGQLLRLIEGVSYCRGVNPAHFGILLMQLIGRRQAHSELISLALEHCGRTQLLLELSVARPVNGALYGGRVDRLPVCEVYRHLILIGNSMLVEYLLVC